MVEVSRFLTTPFLIASDIVEIASPPEHVWTSDNRGAESDCRWCCDLGALPGGTLLAVYQALGCPNLLSIGNATSMPIA